MWAALLLATVGLSQAAITPVPSKTYPHTVVLDGSNNVHLYWEFDSTTITFELHVGTQGWLGLGISTGGGMNGADIALGWIDSTGKAELFDTFASGQAQPALDTSQDLTLLSGLKYSNVSMLKWSRQLLSCDGNDDLDIEDGTVRLIYAFGSAVPATYTATAYHGVGNRGSKSLRLLEPTTSSTIPAGASTVQFLNPNYTIPSSTTFYYCRVYQFPTLASKQHVIAVNPIIQSGNEALVHHILLYRCYGPAVTSAHVGASGGCYNGQMPSAVQGNCFNVFASWAVGGGSFEFPSHVGYPVGGGLGPDYLVMETHYDNPTAITGRIDASGLEIVYTTSLRQYDAGIMEIGDVVSSYQQIVPPHYPDYENRGWCKSDCLQPLQGGQPLKVFGSLLHAHLLGKQVYAQVVRGGQGIADLGSDKYYDFNLQESRLLSSEVQVQPGDDLIVNCFYDSTGRTNITVGHLASTDEMCLAYLYYYPTINVTKCESSVTVDEIITKYLGGTGYTLSNTGAVVILTPTSFANASHWQAMNSHNWTSAQVRAAYQSFQLDPATRREYTCVQNGQDLLLTGGAPLTRAQGSFSPYVAPVATCSSSAIAASVLLLLAALILN